MKAMVVFSLALVSVGLALTLHRAGSNAMVSCVKEPASGQAPSVWPGPRSRGTPPRCPSWKRQISLRLGRVLIAAVEAETDPDRRGAALERTVESVSDAELPAMLDGLARENGAGSAELREALIRRWVEGDLQAAAAWAERLPPGPASGAALEQVAIAWAGTDLPAAADWVEALPEGGGKEAATLALAYEAARTAPLTGLELASELSPTQERDDLLVHAVSQWAAADGAAAAAWAAKVPDAGLAGRLLAAVAVGSAEQDGAAAAALAAIGLNPGLEQNRAAVAIVQRWTQTSPAAAAAWVAQFPDTDARDAAARNLVALWTMQDSEAAGSWVAKLPAGSLREVAGAAYAQAVAEREAGPLGAQTDGVSGASAQ